MKYYLVSYSYNKGFGNIFMVVHKGSHLNIRDAEKTISEQRGTTNGIIIAINKITEAQWLDCNPKVKIDK